MLTHTIRRRSRTKEQPGWKGLFRGLAVAVLVTLVSVAVFALLMQWVRPSDEVIRIFNQLLKLISIGAGVWSAVGHGSEGGLIRGAAIGLAYMAAGVACYALLSGQQAPLTSYLADLGMGIAGGGIVGMFLSNTAPH